MATAVETPTSLHGGLLHQNAPVTAVGGGIQEVPSDALRFLLRRELRRHLRGEQADAAFLRRCGIGLRARGHGVDDLREVRRWGLRDVVDLTECGRSGGDGGANGSDNIEGEAGAVAADGVRSIDWLAALEPLVQAEPTIRRITGAADRWDAEPGAGEPASCMSRHKDLLARTFVLKTRAILRKHPWKSSRGGGGCVLTVNFD